MKFKLFNLPLLVLGVFAVGASVGAVVANKFSDVPMDHWAESAVNWASENGVVKGYEMDNTFRGDNEVSRYEVVQMLANYDEMMMKKMEMDMPMEEEMMMMDEMEKMMMEMEPDMPMEEEMMSLLETAMAAGNFTTLASAIETAGLTETLNGEGPFTVFAPTDEAFAALEEGALDGLTAEELAAVLKDHVVAGNVMAADLSDGMEVETLGGNMLTVTMDEEGKVMINGAMVTMADVKAGNGVIHAIDMVIMQ